MSSEKTVKLHTKLHAKIKRHVHKLKFKTFLDIIAFPFRSYILWWHRAIDILPGFRYRDNLLPRSHWRAAGFILSLPVGSMWLDALGWLDNAEPVPAALFNIASAGGVFLFSLMIVISITTHSREDEYTEIATFALMPAISIITIILSFIFGNLTLGLVLLLLFITFICSGPLNEAIKEQRLRRCSVWHWYWNIIKEGLHFKGEPHEDEPDSGNK